MKKAVKRNRIEKILKRIKGIRVKARFEFKPQDLWVGLYWKFVRVSPEKSTKIKIHLWICIIPMVPLHIVFGI